MTRRLATEEGLFAGISSGANVAGAVRLAKDMDSGTIVTIICDRGDRYLSTMLFRSVCAAPNAHRNVTPAFSRQFLSE
jgi:cysteine synthase B